MSCTRLLFCVGLVSLISLFFLSCEREKPTPVEPKQLSGPELMAQRQAKFEQSKRTPDPDAPKLIDRKRGEEARAERLARMSLAKGSGGASTMAEETLGCWRVGADVRQVDCFPGEAVAPLAQHFCLNFLAWSFSEDDIEYIDVVGNMYWRLPGQSSWQFLDRDAYGEYCSYSAEISNTYEKTRPWCGKIETNHLFYNLGDLGVCQIYQSCNTYWNPRLRDEGCAQ